MLLHVLSRRFVVGKADASKPDEDNQFIAYQTAAFNANGILDDTLRQSSQGYLN